MDCKILGELKESIISRETTEKVLEIVRRELKFLIKHNILITPSNYEKWFRVFCYLVENNKNLSDVEIFSLYENEIKDSVNLPDGQALEIRNRKEIADTLERIATAIDEKLVEAINTIYHHQENLDNQTSSIINEVKEPEVENKFKRILQELAILKSQNNNLISKLEEYHREITKLNTEIKIAKEEANIDFLTGLYNRRSFDRSLNDLIENFYERNYPFSLILLDIDDFKSVNDRYGHLVGDGVLKEISSVLKIFLRANTIVARTGGEEFGIILPGVVLENAVKVADRIKNIIENREMKIDKHIVKVTVSIGVTQIRQGDNLYSIYERVDRALYKAKNNGKNRVEFLE